MRNASTRGGGVMWPREVNVTLRDRLHKSVTIVAVASTRCNGSLVLIVMLLAISGCIVTAKGEGESRHHVVIGFGIVSTKEDEKQAVVATDVNAVGIILSDRPGLKFGIGYASSTVVTVPSGATDVRVEVFKPFKGPFIVNAPSVVLEEQKEASHVP
jgi:hypothetical protein